MASEDAEQREDRATTPEPVPRPATDPPCVACPGANAEYRPAIPPQRVRRRSLLIGTSAAAALGFATRFLPPIGGLRAQTQVGEIYAGFLLLPEGTPPPVTVRPPSVGAAPIIMEQLHGGPQPTTVPKQFSSAQDLAKAVPFPIFTLRQAPDRTRPGSAWLVSHVSGQAFSASVSFQSYDSQLGVWADNVSVTAMPNVSSPYPFWSTNHGPPSLTAFATPQKGNGPPSPPGAPRRRRPRPRLPASRCRRLL